MLRNAVSSILLCLTSLAGLAAEKPKIQIMPEDQVRAGMHGVAYTVFEGVTPETMDVEILGVLRNMGGPKADVILARLHGKKVEYFGVVAGMSGSPVYIDGKLVGAIAYRIGEFSKEPIAGITPASAMLEIDAMDKTPAAEEARGLSGEKQEAARTSGPGLTMSAPNQTDPSYANLLKPIETPLVFTGFSENTLRLFSKDFASVGVMPVMGAGSVSNDKQPEPLSAGIGRQRHSGARRHEHRGHLHRHVCRRLAPVGLRSSVAAIGQRRYADDQGDGAGHSALGAELVQDSQQH